MIVKIRIEILYFFCFLFDSSRYLIIFVESSKLA
nr:MAG TPA: hypothetical protein [Caudoviricetes sp.]